MRKNKSKCYNKSLSFSLDIYSLPIILVTTKYYYEYRHFYSYFNNIELCKNSDSILNIPNKPKELKLLSITLLV